MSWNNTNFDWNRAKAFLVVAECGSFSAAAKELNLTQPTLGRQIAALEEELGIILFKRAGNTIELTDSGKELLEHVRIMSEAANKLSLSASGKVDSLEGQVCISASELEAASTLPPIVKAMRKKWPEITVVIVATNETSNLEKRDADIAIRSFQPKGQELIAKKLNDTKYNLYASSEYLKSLSTSKNKYDLTNAEFIGTTGKRKSDLVSAFKNGFGLKITESNFTVLTANASVYWELIKSGAGIGIAPSHIADQAEQVVRIDQDLKPLIYGNWLVAHRELKSNRRIRLVYDFIYDEFQKITHSK